MANVGIVVVAAALWASVPQQAAAGEAEAGTAPLGEPGAGAPPGVEPSVNPLPQAAAPSSGQGGTTLRLFGSIGASRGDVETWTGSGGALVLDQWDADGRALRWSVEVGAYGGAASVGVVFPFGDLPVRPYVAGTIGLGVFGGVPGIPVSAAAGLEIAVSHLSIALEGRGTIGGYEDADGVSHAFAAASVLAGAGVRW